MICPNCGSFNHESSAFCSKCGMDLRITDEQGEESLESETGEDLTESLQGVCPQCGAENPDYLYFCGKCGASLKASPAETPEKIWDDQNAEPKIILCPKCRADNPDYLFFCGECGAELRGPPEAKAMKNDAPKPVKGKPVTIKPEAAKLEPTKALDVKPQVPLPVLTMESLLKRCSVRIHNNLVRRPWSVRSFLDGKLWTHGGVIEFTSEYETVSLRIDNDCTVSVVKGKYMIPDLVLKGPHESILSMFPNDRFSGKLSSDIEVSFGPQEGRSGQEIRYRFESSVQAVLAWLFS